VTSVGCVVLSQGTRPVELRRALEAVTGQRDVAVVAVVVGNGWQPNGLPVGVTAVELEDNRGIPEGRNIGASSVAGDILLFLDDDIELVGVDFLARAIAQFDADPSLAVVQPRSLDPVGAPTARRHVPRPGASDPTRSGDVAWFWEGASLIRRTAFDEVGGWPGHFFYGHEGIEVAWRLVDAGYRIRYDADLEVLNPEATPFRGGQHSYLNARNRVWVARRNLPAPLLVLYLLVWGLATVARVRSRAEVKTVGRGFWDGARNPCGPRRPIRWATAWRLTKLGRPPIV
jgi:GT2 family glycosyltransferase